MSLAYPENPETLAETGEPLFEVEILAAMPTRCERIMVPVNAGNTARELVIGAIRSQRLVLDDAFGEPETVPLGVFGLLVDDDYIVQKLDRLELYRPLQQDPMERRRKRAQAAANR